MTDNLILEIEDSIRQERIEKLWKEYGGYILGAALLAIVLTAAITGWRGWNEKHNMAQTTILLEALEKDNKAEELSKITGGLRPGPLAIAHMTAAGLFLADGKKEEALAHYRALAGDQDADPVFRDLAQVLAVRLAWDTADSKTPATDLLKALEPIWSDSSNIWQYHARLETALILAQSSKDYAGARKHLAAVLAATDLPPTLLERARALDHVYSLQMDAAPDAQRPAAAAEEPKG